MQMVIKFLTFEFRCLGISEITRIHRTHAGEGPSIKSHSLWTTATSVPPSSRSLGQSHSSHEELQTQSLLRARERLTRGALSWSTFQPITMTCPWLEFRCYVQLGHLHMRCYLFIQLTDLQSLYNVLDKYLDLPWFHLSFVLRHLWLFLIRNAKHFLTPGREWTFHSFQ